MRSRTGRWAKPTSLSARAPPPGSQSRSRRAATCTVSGATVHLTATGSCTITASQAGNANYRRRAAFARTFTVAVEAAAAPRTTTVPKLAGKKLAAAKQAVARRRLHGRCRDVHVFDGEEEGRRSSRRARGPECRRGGVEGRPRRRLAGPTPADSVDARITSRCTRGGLPVFSSFATASATSATRNSATRSSQVLCGDLRRGTAVAWP